MRRVLFLTAVLVGVGSPVLIIAQQPRPTVPGVSTPRAATSPSVAARDAIRVLPGTRDDVYSTIQGNALDASDRTLADTAVRLRDARFGHVITSTMTDKAGVFSFPSVDPGSYVIELVGPDQKILAASQIVNVNAGEVASAIVKMPFRIRPYAGVLGHSATSATLIAATAAASGVLATQVAGEQKSPRR
jgi:hypothetical protein